MSKKSRSPASPNYSLEDLFENTQDLYDEFGRGRFNKEEIASTLGQSSTSGPFKNRFFSLRELGLIVPIEEGSDDFTVTERFIQMRTNDGGSVEFQRAAKDAIEQANVFAKLLEIFEGKLPSQDNVASRLESELSFNPNPAEKVARVFEESMHFAGILDENNNILRIREPEQAVEEQEEEDGEDTEPAAVQDRVEAGGRLTTEIPVGEDAVVTVAYPKDLSPGDAEKVGAVLSALVNGDS